MYPKCIRNVAMHKCMGQGFKRVFPDRGKEWLVDSNLFRIDLSQPHNASLEGISMDSFCPGLWG